MDTIKAHKNKYLTQVDDVDIKERIITTCVYLASNDSIDNWKEISKEEGDTLKQGKEEALLKETEEMLIKMQKENG